MVEALATGRGVSRRMRSAAKAADEAAMRSLDVVVCMALILLLAPLLTTIVVCIWAQDGGTPIFLHERIGKNGRSFRCIKFRTMVRDSAATLAAYLESNPAARAEWDRDHKLRNDPRITAIGRFLRRSSLDELPQLLNVLRGEMSVVGPRPIVAEEVCRFGRRIDSYYSVRPGITGLWQVSGRNNVCYRRRVAMDAVYAHRRTVALNLVILVLTVPAVLLTTGSY